MNENSRGATIARVEDDQDIKRNNYYLGGITKRKSSYN